MLVEDLLFTTLLQHQKSNSPSQEWVKRGSQQTRWTSPLSSLTSQQKAQNVSAPWSPEENSQKDVLRQLRITLCTPAFLRNLTFLQQVPRWRNPSGRVLKPRLDGRLKGQVREHMAPFLLLQLVPAGSTMLASQAPITLHSKNSEYKGKDLAGVLKSSGNCHEEEGVSKRDIRLLW